MTDTPQPPHTDPALRRLDTLVGEWRTEASVAGQVVARSRTTSRWFDGAAFLVQHNEAEPPLADTPAEWIANSPFPVTTVIGLDAPTGTFRMLYSDGRGVSRIYEMSLDDGVWRIWGQAGPGFHQRYIGTFSADGRTITGRWERSSDSAHWERDFDLTYTKVG